MEEQMQTGNTNSFAQYSTSVSCRSQTCRLSHSVGELGSVGGH